MKNNCFDLRTNVIEQSTHGVHCITQMNQEFESLTATKRVERVAKMLPEKLAMTSSFGIDAAVSLHLINQVIPGIPIILIDTGYLFKETYQYAEVLRELLNLNLQIHQSDISAARFESQHGQLWLNGLSGINKYNQMRKVQPLEQALSHLSVNTWFSGVRRTQSKHRKQLPWIDIKNQRFKVHPILDWTDRDMYQYLKIHAIPQHPLFDRGYLSVGDTHSTKSIHEVNQSEELRFFGLKRECGIHE